jgi:hypothetical protein
MSGKERQDSLRGVKELELYEENQDHSQNRHKAVQQQQERIERLTELNPKWSNHITPGKIHGCLSCLSPDRKVLHKSFYYYA